MTYAAWEWALLGGSIFLTVAYHVVWRHSKIGSYQAEVLPVWAYIHEQSCKQSILMIQLMRNMMSIVTGLSAIMLGLLMMLVKMDSKGRKGELAAVSVLCAAGFVMYVFCATTIASLTFNIALYPTDLSKEIDASIVAENRATTRQQLAMLSRHFGFAKRISFISLQFLFLLIHPAALLIVTALSIYMWYYMDTRFGVRLGGVNLSLLTWGVTPSTIVNTERVASEPTTAATAGPPLTAAAAQEAQTAIIVSSEAGAQSNATTVAK